MNIIYIHGIVLHNNKHGNDLWSFPPKVRLLKPTQIYRLVSDLNINHCMRPTVLNLTPLIKELEIVYLMILSYQGLISITGICLPLKVVKCNLWSLRIFIDILNTFTYDYTPVGKTLKNVEVIVSKVTNTRHKNKTIPGDD